MKKLMQWVITATLICGASVFTSCSTEDNPVDPVDPADHLSEKILGKWVVLGINRQPALTSEKYVTTFLSATEATVSDSKTDFTETQHKWSNRRPCKVTISGNKVTLTCHPEENPNITLVDEYTIHSITRTDIKSRCKHTTIFGGDKEDNIYERDVRMVKTTDDYSQDIIGTWEGKAPDGRNVRWEIKDDDTYVYSIKDEDGNWQKQDDEFNDYITDGNMFFARWNNKDDGLGEQRMWWEIDAINNNVMKWIALKENEDGTTYISNYEMTKVE